MGKRTSPRETHRGRYVDLFFSAPEQTVDKLNTVLPTTVTDCDYAKLIICLPPDDRVLQGDCNIMLSCRLIRGFRKTLTSSAVSNSFTVKSVSILLRYTG
jgi:hypothetical protein